MSDELNPSAFPQSLNSEGPFGGMFLRDYFAGQALPAVIEAMMSSKIADHPTYGGGPEGFAATSYDIADAMLAARSSAS